MIVHNTLEAFNQHIKEQGKEIENYTKSQFRKNMANEFNALLEDGQDRIEL